MFFQVASLCMILWSVESAVLDPALYLSPSPPLTDTKDSITAAELWNLPLYSRMAREAKDVLPQVIEERPASKRIPNPMEKAKFFWPSFRSSNYRAGSGNVQVPLTFSLSGLYGKYSPGNVGSSGVIGSSYGTISEVGGTVVSGLAGSGYGKYRTYSGLRIYGGENGPAWSGWGNGRWGNYGKG
ncbi:hypothetical protein B5X24_HaOG202788 [Helicoverpa armigera]|uniref:Uncharacterized protein n=1 Tax=Helicoverpa armigera TaxID=29058 RepID=A0A2W1BXG5_HELAM|nr:hypothetical protein B5X24_HaOG202788 [Helicoverpa armigera]